MATKKKKPMTAFQKAAARRLAENKAGFVTKTKGGKRIFKSIGTKPGQLRQGRSAFPLTDMIKKAAAKRKKKTDKRGS